MTIQDLHSKKLFLLDAISGSHAYGLNHADSDIDKRGVFALPKSDFYGLEQLEQVNDGRNDEVYYELKRFMHLLIKNNPNILELLLIPKDCTLFKHPLFELIKIEDFLCKKAKFTFAGYAAAQIKKARGLNKKIVNPVDKERKTVLDFCYVNKGQGSTSLASFLKTQNIQQENCGLVNIANMKGLYALFHSHNHPYSGIIRQQDSNDIALSSIPKGEQPLAYLHFNKDGYSVYCKEYRQYWEWVEKRNKSRYQNTLSHGKNYDSKNMMHTFRLLHCAEEIAKHGIFQVRRTDDRDFLMKVRRGAFEYNALLEIAEEKIALIETLFEASSLPESPNQEKGEELLIEIREAFYKVI